MKIQGMILMSFLLWVYGSSAQSQIRKLTQRNIYLSDESEINTISQCAVLNPDISIRNIFIDRHNIKYLATKNEGLVKLKECSSNIQSILKTQQSYFINKDQQGNIWVATSDNQLVNLTNNKKINIPIDQGEAFINFIHFTRGYIWVGTLSQGLILLQENGKKTDQSDPLATLIQNDLNTQSKEIYDLFMDQANNIWLATGNGLFKINKAQNQGGFINSSQNKVIKSITGDQDCIWFSTLGELWKLNLTDNKLIQLDIDPKIGVIEDLTFDHNDQLWIAGNVVAHYPSKADITSNNVRIFDNDKGFESRKAVCLAVDHNNVVWVGTSGSGVYMVQNESHQLVSIDYVQSFQETQEGFVYSDDAQKVNVLQVGYTIKDALDLSELSFGLFTSSGQKIQLSETGTAEYYRNLSSTRSFKVSGIDSLSSGLYIIKAFLNDQEVGKISYELK